jgi:hypothetical protein
MIWAIGVVGDDLPPEFGPGLSGKLTAPVEPGALGLADAVATQDGSDLRIDALVVA